MQSGQPIRKREANLDLLRIISMFLIILLHSVDHSGVLEAADRSDRVVWFYVYFVYAATQVCVNLYVLISGYFLVTSKFRINKLVTLWLEVVFYSVTLKLVFMLLGEIPFSILSLISCFVPVFTGRYWFITIYFGLYLVSPFINILVSAMTEQKHAMLNVLLFVLFSVSISIHPAFVGMNSGAGWGLAWFIVLYLAAAWVRLYYKPNGKCGFKLVCWLLIALVMTTVLCLGKYGPSVVYSVARNWWRYDSVPAYVASLLMFLAFLNIRIKNEKISRVILGVAPATLGVYLIHAHAEVSPWSWEILNLPKYMESMWFPLVQMGAVILIFVICVVVDMIREKTIGRLMKTTRLDGIINVVVKKMVHVSEKIMCKL